MPAAYTTNQGLERWPVVSNAITGLIYEFLPVGQPKDSGLAMKSDLRDHT
jgi:hypothetical protein